MYIVLLYVQRILRTSLIERNPRRYINIVIYQPYIYADPETESPYVLFNPIGPRRRRLVIPR